MQQAVDEDGYIWNVDANGQAVGQPVGRVNQSGASPSPFQVGTKDPTQQYKGPNAAADLESANLTNEQKRAALLEAKYGKLPPGYRWKPDMSGAEPIPGLPGPKGQGGRPALTAKEFSDAVAAYQSAIKLRKSAEDMQAQFDNTIGKTKGPAGLADFFPAQEKDVFNSMGQRNRGDLKRSQGFTGGEGNTLGESSQLYDPYTPTTWDRDKNALSKIQALRDLADETEKKAVMMLGGTPDANGNITPIQDSGPTILPQAEGAQADPGVGPMGVTAQGGLRFEKGLSGLPNAVADMIGRGMGASEIVSYLNEQYAPYGASVGPDLAGTIGGLVQRHMANPRAPVKSLGTGWENFSMLPAQQDSTALGRAADTNVGNFAMHAANAATAGLPAYLAGDQGAAVMDASRQARWKTSLGGDVAGSLAAMAGINGVAGSLGKAGTLLTRSGGVGGDMLYGATRGGLENGPTGAITGALAAGAGNKLGGGLVNTAGRVARGVSDPAVNYLSERGIPLTLGQLMGNRGLTGKLLNRLESAPVVGDMMAARRLDSMNAFNREAMRQAIEPVGGSVSTAGREGLDQAFNAVDQGYTDALAGRQFNGNEPQFINDMGAAIQRGQAVPKLGEDVSYIMQNDIGPMFDSNGVMTGDRLQAALQVLRKERSNFAGQPMGKYAGNALTDAENAITGMVGRQAPDVMPRLDAANEAYGNVSTVADAVNTAVNQGGIFTPAQLGRAAVNNTKKFGGKRAAATGNVPFRDLQEAGQQVLPSTVPDSGTAGRAASLLLPAALGGGAVGADQLGASPSVTVPLALLAALSSKTGAKVAQKALTGRGRTAVKVGNALIRNSRKGGIFGSALSAGAVMPQLTQ